MDEAELEEQSLRLWDTFLAQSGDEFEFRLARTARAILRDGEENTFSEQAMDTLVQHLALFIGTRLSRYNDEQGRMPHAMTVRIKVAVNASATNWDAEPDIVINADDDIGSPPLKNNKEN